MRRHLAFPCRISSPIAQIPDLYKGRFMAGSYAVFNRNDKDGSVVLMAILLRCCHYVQAHEVIPLFSWVLTGMRI